MLECIIEHHHVAATSSGLLAANNAIFLNYDFDVGIERPVHEHFVLAVAAEYDRGVCPGESKTTRNVRRERRLPGATHR